jgi:hypothetical protein
MKTEFVFMCSTKHFEKKVRHVVEILIIFDALTNKCIQSSVHFGNKYLSSKCRKKLTWGVKEVVYQRETTPGGLTQCGTRRMLRKC